MPVQKIPLEALQKIRQQIKNALELPDSENHPRSWSSLDEVDELPEPDSLSDLGDLFNFGGVPEEETHVPNTNGKWFISTTNPGSVLTKLPGLKLKAAVRLVGYLHRTAEEGVGVIWAVPEDLSTTAQLEKALATSGDQQHPPQPEGAFADVMAAIQGDRSPASWIVASMLRREFREFGALGKSCNWLHHRLIDAIPAQAKWQWRTANPPKDLVPKVVIYPDNKVAIEFFTCRVTAPVAIFQHIDQYPANQYQAASVDRPIAIPQRQ